MALRLSGFPSGLLSLVGSQSFGTAPKELADVISSTVDVGELYLLSKQEPEVLIIAAPVNGLNAGIRVPLGEVWRIVCGGAYSSCGVGSTVDWTLVVESQAGAIPLMDTYSQVASTTRWRSIAQLPFWLVAGDQVTFFNSAQLGPAPTMSVALLIQRLRA